MLNALEKITISTNYWRVPDPQSVLSGWLEGLPTVSERLAIIGKAEEARQAWKPSEEAYDLVSQFKGFIGQCVKVQFWCDDMWMFAEEAPFPVIAKCIGIIVKQHNGFPQAFMELVDVRQEPTEEGFPADGYLLKRKDGVQLAPLANIYEVFRLSQ